MPARTLIRVEGVASNRPFRTQQRAQVSLCGLEVPLLADQAVLTSASIDVAVNVPHSGACRMKTIAS